jgi:ssRNA-specific RNase YbeY (16S rRNA maturation enzyme)
MRKMSDMSISFVDWKRELDRRYAQNDVCLYRLKYVYEKRMKEDPNFLESDVDIFVDTDYNKNDNDEKYNENDKNDENVFYLCSGDTTQKNKLKDEIVARLRDSKNVRVGFYDNKEYYLLSTNHNENEKYTKCLTFPYDDIHSIMYYMVRYNIDYDAAYMLSGMKMLNADYMMKNGVCFEPYRDHDDSPCNYDAHKAEFLRFFEEYFESFDYTTEFRLNDVIEEIRNIPRITIPDTIPNRVITRIDVYEILRRNLAMIIDVVMKKHRTPSIFFSYLEYKFEVKL